MLLYFPTQPFLSRPGSRLVWEYLKEKQALPWEEPCHPVLFFWDEPP